jgi:hypothetical protein
VSKCTGIGETNGELSGLQVYPNPNKGNFILSSESAGSFVLINELGQVLRKVEFTDENHLKAEITDLQKGIYFLERKGSSQQSAYKIVVTD